MKDVVLGLFSEQSDAENAINELKDLGYNYKDISIVMRDREGRERLKEDTGAGVTEGAVSGAATGGVLGGIAGLLIGVGAIAIPGIGTVLIGGPLAAALGLTGAAATTVSGAVTGAVAGGLVGALTSLGVPRERAIEYERKIKEGAVLLAVPVSSDQEQEAKDILDKHGAEDIQTIDLKNNQ